ncbi:MAG: hypothetical protein H7A25_17795 [Leptospiraceae bacterium]|nr:hypothetical protein [Leptospiraceae bacterium]
MIKRILKISIIFLGVIILLLVIIIFTFEPPETVNKKTMIFSNNSNHTLTIKVFYNEIYYNEYELYKKGEARNPLPMESPCDDSSTLLKDVNVKNNIFTIKIAPRKEVCFGSSTIKNSIIFYDYIIFTRVINKQKIDKKIDINDWIKMKNGCFGFHPRLKDCKLRYTDLFKE